jgi:manganese transport protein
MSSLATTGLATSPSSEDLHASVPVPSAASAWPRRLLAFLGPGFLVSVGYMDPGNWATDIAGGSRFGYTLLSVVLLSSLIAIVLQALAARLGIATDRNLAQACRDHYSPVANLGLWLACELAIVACDLAEVIGTAIALNLLFGLPLVVGAAITALDVFLVLLLLKRGFRSLEAFVVALLVLVAACFVVQIALAAPSLGSVVAGFVPRARIARDPAMLYVATGIVGATVMPHNLYLHSAVVQTRAYPRTPAGRRSALRWAVADSTLALALALFVNAAILVVAAAVFHDGGRTDVVEIEQASALLSPMLGVGAASVLFATALLASGVNSTVTATLAGQIAMEGFLRLRIPDWARRVLTRGVAVVPVVIVIAAFGERGVARLLVFSQVVLSMQLPFAVIPLVRFVSDRRKMGALVTPWPLTVLAALVACTIVVLDLELLADTIFGG